MMSRAWSCAIASGATPRSRQRQLVRRIVVARQCPDDVEQLLLGEPHQRAAQQRAEGEPVALIGEDTGDRDQVLDLLPPVEALAGLGGDGDAALLQSLLVTPELAPGGRQQCDVAGPAQAVARRSRSRESDSLPIRRAHMSATASASPSRCCAADGLTVFIRHFDVQGRDRGPSAALQAGTGSSAWKPGWPFSSESGASKRSFTYSIIGGQERKLVAMESTPSAACARNAARAVHVGRNVGAAKAIDRLLGISHEEERARPERERRPVVRRHCSAGGSPQRRQKISVCSGIGVLEFVDKNVAETRGQRPAHVVVIAQQVAGGEDEVVEVQQRRRALVLPEARSRPARPGARDRRAHGWRRPPVTSSTSRSRGRSGCGPHRSIARHRPWPSLRVLRRLPTFPSSDTHRTRRPY